MKKASLVLAFCAVMFLFGAALSGATEVRSINISPADPWVGDTVRVDLVMGPVLARSTEKVLIELMDEHGGVLIDNTDHLPWNTVNPQVYWEIWPYNWSFFVPISGVAKVRVSISDNGKPFVVKEELDYVVRTSPLCVISYALSPGEPVPGYATLRLSIGPIAAHDSAEMKILLLDKNNLVIGDNSANAEWNFVRPEVYWSAWDSYSWAFEMSNVHKVRILLSQNGGPFEAKKDIFIGPRPNISPAINLLLSD